jgi:chromosome partitioning protein
VPENPGAARIIAIANQKGGVGKSTTAVSLGAALADLGYRVLVIDLDPQGNASTGMGIRHEAREVTVYNVVVAESPLGDAIVPTPVERLHAVPSTIDLAGAEIELVSQFSRETRLKKAIEPVVEGVYDFIFLDCPPSLGLLTINALTAAEELIVPIQCEYYALEGLGQLLRNVSLVQQNINQGLRLSGIVMTMFDPRTKLSEQVVEEVKRYFGDLVYDVIIPRTVRLSEAPGFGQPITVYDPKSKGADSYRRLATEVALRPPPPEPMPIFDDLPAAVLPAMDEAVTQPPSDDAALEDLATPTVHEVIEHMEAEEEGAGLPSSGPEASGAALPTPPEPPAEPEPAEIVRPTAEGEAEAVGGSGEARAQAQPGSAGGGAPGSVEAGATQAGPADAPSATSEREARVRSGGPGDDRAGGRAAEDREAIFEIDLPLGEDEFWEEGEEPPAGASTPATARVSAPPPTSDRRVVVIDEDAEPAPPAPTQVQPERPSPTSRAGVGKIGATLEEEGAPKRRWRLFRKGGE